MRRRIVGLVGLLALVASACGSLGPDFPSCGFDLEDVLIELIMELQAVPTAEVGACLEDLRDGWSYAPLEAERGRAVFWLNSDRMGDQFLEITLTEMCEPTGSPQLAQPYPGVDMFVDIDLGPSPINITLVPVAERHTDYGASIGVALSSQRIKGRDISLEMDAGNPSASDRVNAALDRGHYVLVFDDRDVSNETVELRIPGDTVAQSALVLETAVTRIKDRVPELRYRGTWYHVFEGGCLTYRIDADGSGVQTLEEDIRQVVSFYPLGDMRRAAVEAGFEVGSETRLGDDGG